jgi:hypothetical protein
MSTPLSSPEDGNSSGFLNAMISRYLEFRTMDEVHKRSDSESLSYAAVWRKLLICISSRKGLQTPLTSQIS